MMGTSKKVMLALLWLMLGAILVDAQPVFPTNEIPFYADAGDPVPYASASKVGTLNGNSTYYYWVVVNYPGGSVAPQRFAVVDNMPSTLTLTNYVTITWPAMPNASSYTVVRTSTPHWNSNCVGCVVSAAVMNTFIDDNGGILGALTYTPKQPAKGYIRLDNSGATPQFTTDPMLSGGANVPNSADGVVTWNNGVTPPELVFHKDQIEPYTFTWTGAHKFDYIAVPTGTALVGADCDEVTESGRVFILTNNTSGQGIPYVCSGVSGWTPAMMYESGSYVGTMTHTATPVAQTSSITTSHRGVLFKTTGVITVSRIAVHTGTAFAVGAVARIGIYSATGTRLAQWATEQPMNVGNSPVSALLDTPVTLYPGLYYFVYAVSDNTGSPQLLAATTGAFNIGFNANTTYPAYVLCPGTFVAGADLPASCVFSASGPHYTPQIIAK